jgi:hypothetical protein
MFRQFGQKLRQSSSLIHFENAETPRPKLGHKLFEGPDMAEAATDGESKRHGPQIRTTLCTMQALLTVNVLRFILR